VDREENFRDGKGGGMSWPKYDAGKSWDENWESAVWDCEAVLGDMEELTAPFTKHEEGVLAGIAATQPRHCLARFGEAVPRRLVLFMDPGLTAEYWERLRGQMNNTETQRRKCRERARKLAAAKVKRLVGRENA
jgi:hypothetical protein